RRRPLPLGVLLTLFAACASAGGSADPKPPPAVDGGGADAGDAAVSSDESLDAPAEGAAGFAVLDDQRAVFRTDQLTVEGGQERYLCFTTDIPDEIVIDGYHHGPQSFVHHVVPVRTNAPEPDGFSECDVLFRTSWDPLFITGAGSSEIRFEPGVGHDIKAGTQLLVQLHLLNT